LSKVWHGCKFTGINMPESEWINQIANTLGSISRTAKASMNNSMSFHFHIVTAHIIQSSRHKEHYGNLQNWKDRTKVNQMQKDRQSQTVRNRQASRQPHAQRLIQG
jgi:hypothetical protein